MSLVRSRVNPLAERTGAQQPREETGGGGEHRKHHVVGAGRDGGERQKRAYQDDGKRGDNYPPYPVGRLLGGTGHPEPPHDFLAVLGAEVVRGRARLFFSCSGRFCTSSMFSTRVVNSAIFAPLHPGTSLSVGQRIARADESVMKRW